jgi:hypothetical protein
LEREREREKERKRETLTNRGGLVSVKSAYSGCPFGAATAPEKPKEMSSSESFPPPPALADGIVSIAYSAASIAAAGLLPTPFFLFILLALRTDPFFFGPPLPCRGGPPLFGIT